MATEVQTLATIQQRDALRRVLLFPTPGNLVNLGVELYRQDFKTYLQIAATAYLWLVVPVYGWAKFFALSALISRLAYGRLLGQPEDLAHARTSVSGRNLWRFFALAIIVGFLYMIGYIVLVIGVLIVAGAIGFAIAAVAIPLFGDEIGSVMVGVTVVLVAIGALAIGLIWLGARLSIPDAVLVVEGHQAADRGIGRSWNLTKGNVLRVTVVVSTTFTLALPILLFMNYAPQLLLPVFLTGDPTLLWLLYMLNFVLNILSNIVALPLWQCIKAVIYCDLRMRREGMDLMLRDRSVDDETDLEQPLDQMRSEI